MKGANTVFAQDARSNVILYTRADILRKDEANEIKQFVAYWRRQNKEWNETLVFDCHFTRYDVLDELAQVTFVLSRYASATKSCSNPQKIYPGKNGKK